MTILETDVYDMTFMKMSTADKTAFLSAGNNRFDALCLKYNIDSTKIPISRPYTPLRIGVVCVLIEAFKPLIGTDWREINSGIAIDTYKVKVDELMKELGELLASFTPAMCGYDDDDDDDNNSTSNVSVTFARA